jgi:hypothetical protein
MLIFLRVATAYKVLKQYYLVCMSLINHHYRYGEKRR